MPPNSSTWPSDRRPGAAGAAIGLALALCAAGAAANEPPRLCLPPIFEGGRRLQEQPAPDAFWLPLLLRQHELCWYRAPSPETQRVALLGNSAVYGFGLRAEDAVGEQLNRRLAAAEMPAHVFNLAQAYAYQVRDAVVLRALQPYGPDVVVYPLALDEFIHLAPIPFAAVGNFFHRNRDALFALIADDPDGLAEPLARYQRAIPPQSPWHRAFDRLRELGQFTRVAARNQARTLARRLGATLPAMTIGKGRQTHYDCAETLSTEKTQLTNWQRWNILAYVQQLRDQLGIDVLIVNWPIAHEPVGACYNVRYSTALVAEFNDFLREQCATRGLDYLDLHALLPPEDFFDSLHPTAAGHARIADAIATALAPIVERRVRLRQ